MSERKKVIVSGASSGIGKATAVRFASEGWDVCLTALDEEGLKAVVASLPPGQHLICPGDYSRPETAELIERTIAESWNHVDALVSCAGVYRQAEIIDSTWEDWHKPLDIMLDGAVRITRVAVPFMKEGGRVVHVTSIHGARVEHGSSAYALAKAAVNQYCRALAVELAPRGILANAIAPGFVDTPMSVNNGVSVYETDLFRQNYGADGYHLPLKRGAQPEEIAGVAYFLAGPDSSYITGQIITVDGGLTITF